MPQYHQRQRLRSGQLGLIEGVGGHLDKDVAWEELMLSAQRCDLATKTREVIASSEAEKHQPSRFLIIMTARLEEMISRLHEVDRSQHAAVYREYQSELLE